MKLYYISGGKWAGTQDDAKALAKSTGGDWTAREVPTDKPGLLAFLNATGREVAPPAAPAIVQAPMPAEDIKAEARAGGQAFMDRMAACRTLVDLVSEASPIELSDAARIVTERMMILAEDIRR